MDHIETAQESNTALLHWQPELETDAWDNGKVSDNHEWSSAPKEHYFWSDVFCNMKQFFNYNLDRLLHGILLETKHKHHKDDIMKWWN